MAFGSGSIASYANSVAIGAGSVTGAAAPTGTGYLTGTVAPLSEVSVGSPTALRRITNVADGSAPQDAVTVSQLTTGMNITASSIASLTTSITNGTLGLVEQVGAAPGNGAITVGASTGGTSVDFTGTSGARQLTGVADGTAPTDAVNVSQLQAVASAASDAVTYDDASHTSVTLGGVGAASAVALTNIAAGAITATSTDAVNGSQLFALETQIGTLGAQITPSPQTSTTGGSSASSKYVAVNSTGNAASATGTESVAIGGSSTASSGNSVAVGSGAQATRSGSSAVGANAVASAPNAVAIGSGSEANEANSVSVGSPGNERTITNVAPGVNPTDAANMAQLNGVQDSVNSVARSAYSGIAAATALSMIPEVDPGKTLSVGIGTGSYKGYSAVAIGFTARISQSLKMKGGVSMTDSGTVYGAGVGYQW